jgi:nucleotide-binding universal stress UspA family protein
MFRKIVVPVELEHTERLERALEVAASIAKSHDASLCYISVTGEAPSGAAHSPGEFQKKLDAFAAEQAKTHGVEAEARAVVAHDPAVDLDGALLETIEAVGADLVVMQSHVPGLADHLWPSNGGTVARRAAVSVMLVR